MLRLLLFYQPDSTHMEDGMYQIGYYIGSFLPMIIIGVIAIFMYRAIRQMKNRKEE